MYHYVYQSFPIRFDSWNPKIKEKNTNDIKSHKFKANIKNCIYYEFTNTNRIIVLI